MMTPEKAQKIFDSYLKVIETAQDFETLYQYFLDVPERDELSMNQKMALKDVLFNQMKKLADADNQHPSSPQPGSPAPEQSRNLSCDWCGRPSHKTYPFDCR